MNSSLSIILFFYIPSAGYTFSGNTWWTNIVRPSSSVRSSHFYNASVHLNEPYRKSAKISFLEECRFEGIQAEKKVDFVFLILFVCLFVLATPSFVQESVLASSEVIPYCKTYSNPWKLLCVTLQKMLQLYLVFIMMVFFFFFSHSYPQMIQNEMRPVKFQYLLGSVVWSWNKFTNSAPILFPMLPRYEGSELPWFTKWPRTGDIMSKIR